MQSLRSTMIPRVASVRAFSTSAPRPLARMQLIGRLGDTPEHVPTSSGRDLIKYNLAVQYGKADETGKRNVSWFRVASFPEQQKAKDYLLSLRKGTMLYVDADAKMESFEAEGGEKRYALNLVTRNFETLSKPRDASENESA